MPLTKAPAKREVETVVDEGEEKQKETPLSTPTKKKKLVKKSKSKAEENEKKRKIEEEEEKEEEDAAKVALKEDDEEGGDDDVAETTASKTKHSTKRARANKEKAGKNAMEMTKKIKEKQEKERKIKTKEEEEKEEDGKADADAGEADAGEEEKGERGTPPAKKKSSNKVTVGKKQPAAAAAKGGGRAKRGSAKLEPAVVEEAPVVKVPSSVPQLKELKQIMEREMIEHEEASASMRAAEMERIAALKALDEANKKAEFSGSHLNRVARRMKQTARKVAAQTVNAQMLEQTMITKTVKNWAKSKDEGMKEASDICMSIMNEWIDLVRNTAHLMQQQQQHKHEGPATESPMDVDTEKKGEETKAGEEEENPLDVKKESKASEENEKNAAKREDEEKKKVEKEEQKPRGGMPPPKILPGGIKVEPNLPGPLADIYKKAAPGASKILEEAKRKTAAMHSIVPKEPDHSSVRMKVLSYLQSTFKLSKDAALTCEAALFNAKAVVGLDYKATLKKLSEDGMSVLKSGSANLDVGRVPPGLTLFMQQTKSLQTKKKRKRKSLK
ncbi:unnamed protein product [Bathycoccus prasinos]